MKSIGKILVVLAVVVCPAVAWGNSTCDWGWGGSVGRLEQVGSDIQIGIRLNNPASPDCPPYSGNINLWRISDLGNKLLVDNYYGFIYTLKYTAMGTCEYGGQDTKQKTRAVSSSGFDDCDGDGVRECPMGYCSEYGVEVIDTCAPPGAVRYDLSSYGVIDWPMDGNATYGFSCLSSMTIDVVGNSDCGPWENEDPENVDPCLYPGGVVPDDDSAGSGDDDNDDNDDSSCGGCMATGDPAFPLAAIMFTVGFVALVVTRRKR